MSTPIVITRNGIDKELTEQVFGKKSDNAGKKFLSPVVDSGNKENFLRDVDWMGLEQAAGSLNKNLRLIFADIYLKNLERNEGVLNEEEFKEEAADFTAARVSLSDIEEQLDDLQALQMNYSLDPELEMSEEGKPLTAKAAEIIKSMVEVTNKIKPLRAKKALIEAEYASRAEKRAKTKAENEAKKKAASATATVTA